VEWAGTNGTRWAFSLGNARAGYTTFHNAWGELDRIDWLAVQAADFRDASVKDKKQAEFLFHGFFPFGLVSGIGVLNQQRKTEAQALLAEADREIPVIVKPGWYY
jgi:hypothetical protein